MPSVPAELLVAGADVWERGMMGPFPGWGLLAAADALLNVGATPKRGHARAGRTARCVPRARHAASRSAKRIRLLRARKDGAKNLPLMSSPVSAVHDTDRRRSHMKVTLLVAAAALAAASSVVRCGAADRREADALSARSPHRSRSRSSRARWSSRRSRSNQAARSAGTPTVRRSRSSSPDGTLTVPRSEHQQLRSVQGVEGNGVHRARKSPPPRTQ